MTMSLEGHLGENHILVAIHKRYLGAKISLFVYILSVLVFTFTEAAADTRESTAAIVVQFSALLTLTFDGILSIYVECVGAGFLRAPGRIMIERRHNY